MTNSTLVKPARKPRELSKAKLSLGIAADFPLTPNISNGQWCKKVRGTLHYFGAIDADPRGDAAIKLWAEQKDDLLAGRKPRGKIDGVTVAQLCDRFLQAKDQQLAIGEITKLTRNDYEKTTDRIIAEFGKSRVVTDLVSEDFEGLRATLSKTRKAVALGNEIQRMRVVFKYAYDAGLIPQPMRYGPLFRRPTKKALRVERAKRPQKLFSAKEIEKLLDKATPQFKAMILLGVNCGFGNNDCAKLTFDSVNLDTGWIDFPRPKTGIARRCPLWPETIAAMRAAIAIRRKPKNAAHESLIFVTAALGSFAKETTDNPISKEFSKLTDETKIKKPGRGFYSLRHTFRTVADESRDQPATRHIMGHADDSIDDLYRERIDDIRLLAVSNYVRTWLYK